VARDDENPRALLVKIAGKNEVIRWATVAQQKNRAGFARLPGGRLDQSHAVAATVRE
jgi:hypothetical protein